MSLQQKKNLFGLISGSLQMWYPESSLSVLIFQAVKMSHIHSYPLISKNPEIIIFEHILTILSAHSHLMMI